MKRNSVKNLQKNFTSAKAFNHIDFVPNLKNLDSKVALEHAKNLPSFENMVVGVSNGISALTQKEYEIGLKSELPCYERGNRDSETYDEVLKNPNTSPEVQKQIIDEKAKIRSEMNMKDTEGKNHRFRMALICAGISLAGMVSVLSLRGVKVSINNNDNLIDEENDV